MKKIIGITLLCVVLLTGCASEAKLSEEEAQRIANEVKAEIQITKDMFDASTFGILLGGVDFNDGNSMSISIMTGTDGVFGACGVEFNGNDAYTDAHRIFAVILLFRELGIDEYLIKGEIDGELIGIANENGEFVIEKSLIPTKVSKVMKDELQVNEEVLSVISKFNADLMEADD